MPQRYPGHILKQTFTKFLAEATLPHLKCSFDLVIVSQKEKKLFYSLYVTEMSSNFLFFFFEDSYPSLIIQSAI